MIHNISRESVAIRAMGAAVLLGFALIAGAAQMVGPNVPALALAAVSGALGLWLAGTAALRVAPAKLLRRHA